VYVAQKKCHNTTERAAMPRSASSSDKRCTPDWVLWTADRMFGFAATNAISVPDVFNFSSLLFSQLI
jgi:hypothetical protein